MIHIKIPLYHGCEHIYMTAYISEPSPELPDTPRKAVLVLPGGGYEMTSDREAEPVAKAYFAAVVFINLFHSLNIFLSKILSFKISDKK